MSIRIESNRPLKRFPRDLRISFVVKEHHRWEPWWAAAPLWKWEQAASSQEPVLLPPTFPPQSPQPPLIQQMFTKVSVVVRNLIWHRSIYFLPCPLVCPISTHDKKTFDILFSYVHVVGGEIETSTYFYWAAGWSKLWISIFSLCTISTHCAGHYHIRLRLLHLGGVCPTQHSRWSPKKRPVAQPAHAPPYLNSNRSHKPE